MMTIRGNARGYDYERYQQENFERLHIGTYLGVSISVGLKEGFNMPCARCGKLPDSNGHDACLGELPGVIAACCGHGSKKNYNSYIVFENGITIRGIFKVDK